MSTRNHIVIVGGGITGLAAAFWLQRYSPTTRITVLESSDRLGGKIVTERSDGFVIEGGPDSFLSIKPRGVGLCRELGLFERLEGTNESTRRTFVLRDGVLHRIPEGLSGLVPANLEAIHSSTLFSDEGKARFAQELDLPALRDDGEESLGAFARRRFGPEVYERLIEPLMAGIYAGDADALSVEATFPQLLELERSHGSVIRGVQHAAAQRTQGIGTRPGFLTPRGGTGEMVDALIEQLRGVATRLKTPVTWLRPNADGYEVGLDGGAVLDAEGVILATPALITAHLLEEIAPAATAALSGIPSVSSATVSLAFTNDQLPGPLLGYGYVIPRREGRPALACTWNSSKFAHRAPPGHSLLRVFLGRAGQESIVGQSDDALIRLAREELQRTMTIRCAPTLVRVFRWPDAMPQYNVGHIARIQSMRAAMAQHPAVRIAGNFLSGVGIPDCIASGETAARELVG